MKLVKIIKLLYLLLGYSRSKMANPAVPKVTLKEAPLALEYVMDGKHLGEPK